MRAFNARFAGLDETTDVLAFPATEGGEIGDIIISMDRVEAQAQEAGHSLDKEAATLAVHGFLHLLGYDHATKAEERKMFARTDEIVGDLK
jgi:probable rRNA maturation factor